MSQSAFSVQALEPAATEGAAAAAFPVPVPVSVPAPASSSTDVQPPVPSARACDECRRKKTKCDMRRPTCGLCARTGSLCGFPLARKRPSRSLTATSEKMQRIDRHLGLLVRLFQGEPSLNTANVQASQNGPPPIQYQRQPSRAPDDLFTNASDQRQSSTPPPHVYEYRLAQGQVQPSLSPHDSNLEPGPVSGGPVSHDMAMHLVNLFFDNIQPWLPLLHKPHFLQRISLQLGRGPDALATLSTEDNFLLLTMFALAARHSAPTVPHSRLPPCERGHEYAQGAKTLYPTVRDLKEPTLGFLQGCILLAYYYYTSGMSSQGWVLVGVCIRFAFDLGLSDLDDPSRSPVPDDPERMEELRRAWWLIWELDTFGSMIRLRPFAVDRRHVCVKLPISDGAWFACERVDSEIPRMGKRVDWEALRTSSNQDERAWFLVAYSLLAKAHDRLLLRESLSEHEHAILENEISCLKLSLPMAFHPRPRHSLDTESETGAVNWIVGTHLLLHIASRIISVLSHKNVLADKNDDTHPSSQEHLVTSSCDSFHILELSAILRTWPPNSILAAHPFFVLSLCPLFGGPPQSVLDSPAYMSFHNLATLIQGRLGEMWDLGRIALRISRSFNKSKKTAEEAEEAEELTRHYPIFMKPLTSRIRKPAIRSTQPSNPQSDTSMAEPAVRTWDFSNRNNDLQDTYLFDFGDFEPPDILDSGFP